MTRWERRSLWISSILILLSLLALVYAAMVSEVRTSSPFFLVFVYLLEIIAGICAGILAGTIVGFFKVRLEQRISTGGRVFIQATGGFAVFLIVMIMSPREQMSRVADLVYEGQLAECRSAVNSTEPSADAEARCKAVIEAFPNKPEPLFLLGRFKHRTSSLRPENLVIARDYLTHALDLYRIGPDDSARTISRGLSDFHLSVFRDVLYAAAVSTADADLRAFGLADGSPEAALAALEKADRLLKLADELGRLGAGAGYRRRVIGVMGVSLIHEAHLRDALDSETLKRAERIFRDAIEIDPKDSYFQQYNLFVVTAHRAYAFEEPSALPTAKDAITRFVEALPHELENRENASFEGRITRWLTGIVDNTRDDPFMVTRPMGGKAIAGESIARFFDEHPKMKSRLLESLSAG